MGQLIEAEFPRNPGEDGNYLNSSISRVVELLDKTKSGERFEQIRLFESSYEYPVNIQYEGNDLEINAPLEWIDYICSVANEEYGQNYADVFNQYALTSIYAKKWINHLDHRGDIRNCLRVKTQTEYEVDKELVKIEYHNSREIRLWQAASALALRAVIPTHNPERDILQSLLYNIQAEEIDYELKEQGYSPNKHKLRKLFKTTHLYSLDSYKVGILNPMPTKELAELAKDYPGFMLAANR